ncbi:four-helix bundle copper-binding protein [Chitinophaga pinensis]|uniref:Four-helix bundle copper-binding protein n=1 Tax=Chitinophaga pinensis TaxID=79329 RepID=A0A5C6LN44_9BACT|nr:four-helix bundle copper-binding protein [Chitinophaga pinensis]TWV98730.1 four-helix bundle copper-binding protein [Chitinophaga pinensis]
MYDKRGIQKCAEACLASSLECDYAIAAFLKSENADKLKDCIIHLLECAAIARATVAVMSIGGQFSEKQCRLCIDVCYSCAQVCEAHMQWAQANAGACADSCRRCAQICEDVISHMVTDN